jgi:hypothetical protein
MWFSVVALTLPGVKESGFDNVLIIYIGSGLGLIDN